MENLKESILTYGSKNDINRLQKLVLETSYRDLENIVKNFITNSAFPRLWDYLLKAFQSSSECHQVRIKIVLALLHELENHESLSSNLTSTLIQRLCIDLGKFQIKHLVEICNFCSKSIQSDKITSAISFGWKELLPDILRILSQKDVVEFDGIRYSGQEFRSIYINSLLVNNWSPCKVIQITAMFSDMTLNKEEHMKVVNKLTNYIEKLVPQEVPPLLYQLLKLCRHQNGRRVFVKLQQYFGLKIYSNLSANSESTPEFDLIESAEDHDVLEAESMVLFHIENAASIGHNCIKDYLNALKNSVKSPQYILHPFQLLTLLTISTVPQYEEQAFDIIRHSIVRAYDEIGKRQISYWYRDVIRTTVQPEVVFTQIINTGQRDFLLEAFVNFAFNLLSIGSALGRDPMAEKQWTLGTIILLKIIKKKRSVSAVVLKTFCNHILTRQSATQYIECLYFLCNTSPLLMLENQKSIIELTENIMQISSDISIQLLQAIMPLIKVSNTIRDHLILILRKCLYSRSRETRQVAVFGFVKLISTLDVSNGGILSQSSLGSFSTGFSLYTQISLSRTTQTASSTFSSEAICWEILEILKRCFLQQAEVKIEFYKDICYAVNINSDLAVPVLEVLWFHLLEFYVLDEAVSPPLNCSEITVLRDTECVLQEPLGMLVLAISQILPKAKLSEDENTNAIIRKYQAIMNSICHRMSNCELVHFSMDDGTDFNDILPEVQQKLLVLKEVLNIFEALISYKFETLSSEREHQSGIIYNLFQTYLRFQHFSKNMMKPKKMKKNEKTSQRDVTVNKTIDKISKTSTKHVKNPDTILELHTVERALKTLLESSVPWIDTDEANTLRTKVELHQHFLQAALNLILKCKNEKTIDPIYQKNNFDLVTSIADTLFNRVVKRFNDYMDFDCTSAVASLECFHAILQLVSVHYSNNLLKFLSAIGGVGKEESLIKHLKPIIEEFERLFEFEENGLSTDIAIKKFHIVVLNNISVLCSFIPNDSNILSVEVYEWLKKIAYNNSISTKVAGNFMNLLCEIHLKYKCGLTFFEHASNSFADVFGTLLDDDSIDESLETLKFINVGTANGILLSLCNYNKNVLDEIVSVIARIKSEYLNLSIDDEKNTKKKEDIKSKEKGVVCHLSLLSTILTNLMGLQLPPGNLSDAVFKNITQFYTALSLLTKHFSSKSDKTNIGFQEVWFEKLVKLAGKKLAPAIYSFVYHLEMGQNKDENFTQLTKKKVASSILKNRILKETKTIPKVIYEMEQFSKFIIQLSKKTKYDLTKYIGQGTTRDFRINLQNIQKDLQKDNSTDQSQNENSLNESTSDKGEENTLSTSNEEVDDNEPRTKKLKT
ncbi:hypothetical protein ABEB36_008041 [Hypothenemus hampei]|uniref:Fanconi anemia group I protein n=1 Tax=Hypothenemus hampei TaxID=57062 RepID=A0ABD1EKH8_HYPHA